MYPLVSDELRWIMIGEAESSAWAAQSQFMYPHRTHYKFSRLPSNFRFRLSKDKRRMTDRTSFIQVVNCIDSCILSTRNKTSSSIVAQSCSWSRLYTYIRWCLFRSRRHTVLSLNQAPAVHYTALLSVQPHQRHAMQTSSFIVIGIHQPTVLIRLLHTLHAQFCQCRCSAHHFSSVCVHLACKPLSWLLIKIPLFGMNGFVNHIFVSCFAHHRTYGVIYHHSLYMILFFVYHHCFVYHQSLYHTWVCIPLCTWLCIPSLVIHGFVYHCIPGTWFCTWSFVTVTYTIVG